MDNNQHMRRDHKKKMSLGKKILLWVISIIILFALVLGGFFAYAYHNVHKAYDKTYKKAQGTTKPKSDKYHMVVKVKGTKKDGSDDKLLYVTGTNGKRDFKVNKLKDGSYTEKADGKVVDNKNGEVLGNTKDNTKDAKKVLAKKVNVIEQKSNNDTNTDNQSVNANDTSKQDINNAKQQTKGPVNYYTSFDMSAAARAVDALGGLDVDGQHMNGNQVVKYYESGHSGAIMSAAMNRKNDIKALVNQGFLNGMAGGTHTNVTWEQAKQMIK